MVTRSGAARAELAGGLADTATGAPCTLQTRFQLCSVSKQFAAAAALLLVEDGQLALDQPVDRWLPGGTPQWSRITDSIEASNRTNIRSGFL
jgi:CubicO group peptidase (beta-lactamase class C family)